MNFILKIQLGIWVETGCRWSLIKGVEKQRCEADVHLAFVVLVTNGKGDYITAASVEREQMVLMMMRCGSLLSKK